MVLWGQTAAPGASRLVRGHPGSTCTPQRLVLESEGPRGRPAVPGASGRCPRPAVSTNSPGPLGLGSEVPGSTSCPGRLRPWSNGLRGLPAVPGRLGLVSAGPRCRPSVPGYSSRARGSGVSTTSLGRLGSGPRARGVDQLLWAIPARVRGHTVSTSCPARRGPGSECPRRRPGVPCDSDPGPRALGVHQHSRETCARVRWPEVSTSSPGRLGPYPMARGVFWLSRVTRDCAKGPRFRPAFLGISRLPLRAPGVDQQARTTLARVRGPVKSTCGSG